MKFLLCLLFLTSVIHAKELQIRYGVGVFLPKSDSLFDVKHGSISLQSQLNKYLIGKAEIGGWIDSNKVRGSSFFGGYSVGSRIRNKSIFIETLVGGVINSNPNNYQAGRFLFMLDMGIGIIDSDNKTIGITYKHLSNGNMIRPNGGRDALQLLVGFPL